MIRGEVNTRFEPIVHLTIRGPQGEQERVAAIVDTGFDGWLTLPLDVIARLHLEWGHEAPVTLGDGRETICKVFAGIAVWDRRRLAVWIDEAETMPLLGSSFLRGYELAIEYRVGGSVNLRKLPKR